MDESWHSTVTAIGTNNTRQVVNDIRNRLSQFNISVAPRTPRNNDDAGMSFI